MEWREQARCRDVDPELFFPAVNGGPDYERQVQVAKDVCGSCSVRLPCLQFAVTSGERDGIWGGMTEHERRRLPYDPALRTRTLQLTS